MKKELKGAAIVISLLFALGFMFLFSPDIYAEDNLLKIGSTGMKETYEYNPFANRFMMSDSENNPIANKDVTITLFAADGVTVVKPAQSVKTTVSGYYKYYFYTTNNKVEPGKYKIKYEIEGFETLEKEINIVPGKYNTFSFDGSPTTITQDDIDEEKEIAFTLTAEREPEVTEGQIAIYLDNDETPLKTQTVSETSSEKITVSINSNEFSFDNPTHKLKAIYSTTAGSDGKTNYEECSTEFTFHIKNGEISSTSFPDSYQYNAQGSVFRLYELSEEDSSETMITNKPLTITIEDLDEEKEPTVISKTIQKNGNLIFLKNTVFPGRYRFTFKIKGYTPYTQEIKVTKGKFKSFVLSMKKNEYVCNSLIDVKLNAERSKRINAGFITFTIDKEDFESINLNEEDHMEGFELSIDSKDLELEPGKHTIVAHYEDLDENYETVDSKVTFTIAHSWDEGKVTKEATCTEDGEKVYKCIGGCGETKIEVLKAGHKPVKDPAVAATYTATGLTEGSHCSVCKQVLKAQQVIPMLTKPATPAKKPAKVVEKPRLFAQVKKSTKTSNKITWKKVKGANQYVVYGNKCGDSYGYKKIATVKKTTFNHKKLLTGRCYKYRVVAYKVKGKKKTKLSTSRTIHGCTLGGAVGNCKSIRINKTKVSLKVKKTFAIKATEIISKKKIAFHHRPFAYETSNKKVATVSATGKIKAVGKGKCKIYVYAQNGKYKTVYVTVK